MNAASYTYLATGPKGILKTIFQVGDLVWVQDMATGKWDIPGKISMGKRRTSMGRVEEMYW